MPSNNAGAMEQAIRKWDGDVYHGHEPEAWADLRMRAREQDAALAALTLDLTAAEDMCEVEHASVLELTRQRDELLAALKELRVMMVRHRCGIVSSNPQPVDPLWNPITVIDAAIATARGEAVQG